MSRIGRFTWSVDHADLLLSVGVSRTASYQNLDRIVWDPIRLEPADLQDLLVIVDASARVISMEHVRNTLRRDIHVSARNVVHEIMLKTGRHADIDVKLDGEIFMSCVVDDREFRNRRIELDREITIQFDPNRRRR